jgi:hypothetical protein
MLTVYTKINGKLAEFSVGTDDIETAWNTVNRELGKKHGKAIMVMVPKNANCEPIIPRSDPSWNRA